MLALARSLRKVCVGVGVRKGAEPKTRKATSTASGAILPEPQRVRGGVAGLVMAVVPGLLLGAAISKNIANFLEENDLFVPADDDDDDD